MNIDTYVPPHSKEDRSKWGSDPYYAMKIGTDKFAISYNTKRQKEMDDILIKYISKGFKLQFLDELKLKGFYLKNKIKLSKIINLSIVVHVPKYFSSNFKNAFSIFFIFVSLHLFFDFNPLTRNHKIAT